MLALPEVRLARAADAAFIAGFSREHIERGLGWVYTRARVLQAMQSRTTNVAIATRHARPVAFGIMEYGDTSAHLVLLGVSADARRKGLGRHVLTWLEECAVTAGIERIRVEARIDNPGALEFYRRLGYLERERVRGYYRGEIDAMCMEKRLTAG